MSNNNINVFDKLVSKTKFYLVIIAILLIIICIIKPILIVPALIVYILIIMYTYWTNQKRMAEVSEHIKEYAQRFLDDIKREQSIGFSEQQIGKSTVNVATTKKAKLKSKLQEMNKC